MRSATICVLCICILMILQCFASISTVDLGDAAASASGGEGLIRPRKLLQNAPAARSPPSRSTAAVEVEVNASLGKQKPSSKSNPRQN
uniref:Uncharacterized protein n=1 Tax=Oryza meridionalis TaxID=40149 RepID=A0A0E0DTB9_9ORYZ